MNSGNDFARRPDGRFRGWKQPLQGGSAHGTLGQVDLVVERCCKVTALQSVAAMCLIVVDGIGMLPDCQDVAEAF
jgi:hypothetical protein